MRRIILILGVMSVSLWGALASASTIDTLTGANYPIIYFGQPDTSFYAQSVVADGNLWDSLTVALGYAYGQFNLPFSVLITGARDNGGVGLGYDPDLANILYSASYLLGVNDTAQQTLTANPNLNVTVGETYFIVLDAFVPGSQNDIGAYVPGWHSDVYGDGEFVYYNPNYEGKTSLSEVNGVVWDRLEGADMGVIANFSDVQGIVPEPASMLLIGMGLAGLLAKRRFSW